VSPSQLSVQLYTVREALQADLEGTVRRIAEIGYTQVEPYNFVAFPGLGNALRSAGLTAPTAHCGLVGKDLVPVFEAAKEIGIATVIEPFVASEHWQTAEGVKATAAALNDVAALGAEYGIRVGYHNHSHEIESTIEGVTALEYLASQLDPAVVLEVDTYWVAVGGHSAADVLGRLGDRVHALHIKDGAITKDDLDQVAVGSGSMPIAEIIAAAPSALRVVELDDSRGDRFEALEASYAWLVKENLA
jgi:sugar phosphate isomerase/epimerase